jgi:hypothetical protein
MTAVPPHVFSTQDRAKHSHLLSYPLGAEVLSRALDEVPQHSEITCSFYAGNAHQFLERPTHLVLSALYRRRARTFNDGAESQARGVYEPRRTITVFAVPRGLRHAIKTALLQDGLPNTVRPWLIENAHVMGQTGMSGLNLEYDTATGTFKSIIQHSILPERT